MKPDRFGDLAFGLSDLYPQDKAWRVVETRDVLSRARRIALGKRALSLCACNERRTVLNSLDDRWVQRDPWVTGRGNAHCDRLLTQLSGLERGKDLVEQGRGLIRLPSQERDS